MSIIDLPFTKSDLERISRTFPTPFHIYDEKAIRENARQLLKAFAWNEGFKEYFAVKATPNPFILKILKSEGFGTDCSSLPELVLSEKAGITGNDIMFSSNDTPAIEFQKARQLDAIINLDDISHIPFLEENGGIPDIISVRYNPGKLREGSFIMGNPENAKYGFTRQQVFAGLVELRQKGSKMFGIHTFIASNELNPDYFVDTHDTGAHGHSMGFNYNGKLRSSELLLRENGDVVEIRRPETMQDYFATLDFSQLDGFPV